jgi:DNA-binding beta-propeller fold protein YncE
VRRPRRCAAAAALAVTALVAACGSNAPARIEPLSTAPEPAVSPPAAARLPGTVMALAGSPEGITIDRAALVEVAVRDPGGIVLFALGSPPSAAGPAHPGLRRTVPIPGEARHLALAGPDGPLLVPDEPDNRLLELALPSGRRIASVPTGRNPHNAAAGAGGTIFVVDELANTIGTAACGAGPTHAVTGDSNIVWVADTNGGRVLGFAVSAHRIHQVASVAVGPRPYGLAFDPSTDTLWVTITGADELVGLHLRGAAVTGRTTYATVRQPNSVAVDQATGELVVTGATAPGAVQFLP